MEAFVTLSQIAALAKLRRLKREFTTGLSEGSPLVMTAGQHRWRAELLREAREYELAAEHDTMPMAIDRRDHGAIAEKGPATV
jgi:hypothetical protein